MPRLQIQVLSANELLQCPEILSSIVTLVNDGYLEHKEFNGNLRFESDEELCCELGSSGLCAVLLDGVDPVATASVKTWTNESKKRRNGCNGYDVKVPIELKMLIGRASPVRRMNTTSRSLRYRHAKESNTGRRDLHKFVLELSKIICRNVYRQTGRVFD